MTKKPDPAETADPMAPVRVTLKKPHTHAGVEYAPDDVVTVSREQAAWMASQNVIAHTADKES